MIDSSATRSRAFAAVLKNTKNEKANAVLFKDQSVKIIRDKVGYDVSGDYGSITAHREVEVSYSESLKKRLKLRLPIVE